MKRTVLVTGGAGYIGSHVLLALLDAGRTPVVVDNLSTGVRSAVPDGVAFHEGDVGDRAFLDAVLAEHRPDAAMHFAGSILVEESVRDPLRYMRNNVANTLTVVEACRAAGCEGFIFSSTAAVYGQPLSETVDETAPTRPINPYGASKLLAETMLREIAQAHADFRPVILRYFNVAGADPQGRSGQRGGDATHLIRAAIEVALGRRDRLKVFGSDYPTADGSCERDFIHVSDLASAHVAGLDYLDAGGAPATLNCGYGRGYSVLQVIGALERVIGRSLPVEHAPRRPGDPARLISDPARIAAALDWRPRYDDLDLILRSALAWQAELGVGAEP
jgi:UDP-glucose 4-epimerase